MNRTRAHVVFVLIILLCSALPLSAEEAGLVIRSPLFGPQVKTSTSVENLEVQSFSAQLGLLAQPPVYNEEQRLLSAVSNGSYPVTPGDAFRLVYLDGLGIHLTQVHTTASVWLWKTNIQGPWKNSNRNFLLKRTAGITYFQ
ncbi:MAG: polysaccharide biosynthesis/export protein [Sphaerochaeta sp.]|nr:polysaccharide biosynthesis/export protein [Sphaerochaeta sp.]